MPVSGLATSGGGAVTLAMPRRDDVRYYGHDQRRGLAWSVGRRHRHHLRCRRSGYNGAFTITAVPTPRSFPCTAAASGLANSGGGSVTFFLPFQVRIGGNHRRLLEGAASPYKDANIQSAINAIASFAGAVTVSGAASTGFTVSYGGRLPGWICLAWSSSTCNCSGCFASVEETNRGGRTTRSS